MLLDKIKKKMLYKVISNINEEHDYLKRIKFILNDENVLHKTKVEFALYCVYDLDKYYDIKKYSNIYKARKKALDLITEWILNPNKISNNQLEAVAKAATASAKAASAAAYAATTSVYAATVCAAAAYIAAKTANAAAYAAKAASAAAAASYATNAASAAAEISADANAAYAYGPNKTIKLEEFYRHLIFLVFNEVKLLKVINI